MAKKDKKMNEILILDEKQIAARRVPLEDTELVFGKAGNWKCIYCDKTFLREGPFLKHTCEPKRRALEITTPLGQAAFQYYKDWMKLKKYGQPGAPAFLQSKFYRSFVNFANLVVKANIARPDMYLQIMVAHDIQPVLWCRDQIYTLYLEWADRIQDPLEQVYDSVSYLIDLANKEGVALSSIVSHLGPQRILSLIRQRRITPWLIFSSSTFINLLKSLDEGELIAFNAVVNSSYWSKKLSENVEIVKSVKKICEELNV